MPNQHNRDVLACRRQARTEQAEVVRRRFERHRTIAERLLSNPTVADALIDQALAMVQLWRAEHICSRFYIEHWADLLVQGPAAIAAAIVIESEDWDMWRQCSPFVRD
jgi:hypothetical protein